MPAHVTTHRLRFCDTDRLGHVNNAIFSVMLEQGRTELAVEAGLPMGGATLLVIVRLELDLVREMNWPGDIRIETGVLRLGNRSMTFAQTLEQDGTVCARATTVLVAMDAEARRAVPIDPWREVLSRYVA